MRLSYLLIASSLAHILYAQSQGAIEQKMLDPIYTQAERVSAKEYERANTTTINAKSLQSRQATSLRDVFALDSSVSVGGAATTAQKIYIRGLEDRLYSVNIDNASQYGNLFHHQGNVTIDPMMIKEITIKKAMPDAYMGAGALAGSMSIRTKDARDFLREGQKFGVLAGLGGYSNQGYRAHLAGFLAVKNTDALLSANWTNILGFHAGNGEWAQGSANNSKSLLVKLNQHLSERDTLTLSYNGLNETSTAPFATNLAEKNVSLFAHTNYNHTATLGYTHKTDPSKPSSTQIRTNLYYNQRSIHLVPLSQVVSNDPEEVHKNIAFTNVGYNLSLSNQFEVFDIEYGLNYQSAFVTDTAAPKDSINRAQESGHIYGGFVKTAYTPNEHWILDIQSRYDVFHYFDKNNQTHLTQGFSPATSITYIPIDPLSVRASYAFLTRGAMPGDATLLGESDVKIHKTLKPESIQNVELDVDYSGSIFSARIAGYYSRLHNFINSYAHDHDHDHTTHIHAPEPHNHGGLRQNMDSAIEIFGYEGGVGADFKGFSGYASIAQNFPTYKGYLLQDTYELGAVSGIIYNLSLQYEIVRYHLRFAWLSQFTQRITYKGYDIYNDQTGLIDKSGYSVHNLYINWEPLGERRLALRLSVNNIFNTFYIAQTSPFKSEAMDSLDSNNIRLAMPNPGIDARFEISYQF